eukprot:310091-Amphidinium_carterae.2
MCMLCGERGSASASGGPIPVEECSYVDAIACRGRLIGDGCQTHVVSVGCCESHWRDCIVLAAKVQWMGSVSWLAEVGCGGMYGVLRAVRRDHVCGEIHGFLGARFDGAVWWRCGQVWGWLVCAESVGDRFGVRGLVCGGGWVTPYGFLIRADVGIGVQGGAPRDVGSQSRGGSHIMSPSSGGEVVLMRRDAVRREVWAWGGVWADVWDELAKVCHHHIEVAADDYVLLLGDAGEGVLGMLKELVMGGWWLGACWRVQVDYMDAVVADVRSAV